MRASLGVGDHHGRRGREDCWHRADIDLALLKIDAKNLPSIGFADYTKVKKGELVLAFGNPEGLENSVTMGWSAQWRDKLTRAAPAIYIQTDAPINPGSSGGPLVDMMAIWWASILSF